MRRQVIFSTIIIKGISAVIAQTLLIRELFIVFNGNELTFGIILAIWLTSGALGSGFVGNLFKKSKSAIRPYCLFQLILSVGLTLSIIFIRESKILLGVPFAEVFNIGHIANIAVLALSLLALCDGAMFNIGFRLISRTDSRGGSSIAKIYLLESIGVIIGGVSFTFVLLNVFNAFQIASLIISLNLLFCSLLILQDKSFLLKAVIWMSFAASLLFFTQSNTLQKITLAKQWQNKNLICYKNSVYGNIAVSKELNQYTVFYDGLPSISIPSPDTYFTEDFIHIPLLTKINMRKALFVGHAVGGLLTEALKYPLEKIVYVELDPEFIKVVAALGEPTIEETLKDPRVDIRFTDARNYIKTTTEKFDCIFVNTGLPTSLAINRYYTQEFFRQAKSVLKNDGIIVLKTWGSLSYLSGELKKINALLLKTLQSVFAHYEVIPGDGFNILIASEQKIKLEPTTLTKNLMSLKPKTHLISGAYLNLRLQRQYSDWFYDNLREDLNAAKINQDLKPTGLYEGLSLYYSQFSKKIPRLFKGFKKIKPVYLTAAIIVFLAIWRIFLKHRVIKMATLNFTILSSGFFAMSIQLITLFLFQTLLGYLFQWLAILTMSLMAGASCGAYYANKKSAALYNFKKLAWLEIVLPCLSAALIAGVITIFNRAAIYHIPFRWLFSLISLSAGLLVGLQMPLVYALYMKTKTGSPATQSSKTAGQLYCMDLVGACIGALIVPLILIPSCGILQTTFMLCLLKIGNGWNILRLCRLSSRQ